MDAGTSRREGSARLEVRKEATQGHLQPRVWKLGQDEAELARGEEVDRRWPSSIAAQLTLTRQLEAACSSYYVREAIEMKARIHDGPAFLVVVTLIFRAAILFEGKEALRPPSRVFKNALRLKV